jgi:AraC-like DNA-binding protein
VAQAVGVSVSQLNRLFHRDLGFSPRDYLQRRRVQAAVLLLKNGARPIKQIAYELGFNSISNFSNWFYRQKGVFPRAFRDDE